MSTLGYCNCCGDKIGRTTANGIYQHNWSKTRQVSLIYGHDGQMQKTHLHIPVCLKCVSAIDIEKVELMLNREASFLGFKEAFPQAIYEGFVEDILPQSIQG